MPHTKIFTALLCLACGASAAEPPPAPPPGPIVTQVMKQELPDMPGKEALMLLVEYPPGGVDPVHRHDAHGLIYVLEGEIVMGVRGGPETVLRPGQAFHEGPDDIHTVGRNASATRPARFLAVLIKNRNTPAVLPAR
ncbi:cupin domain-containing protein [Castellaniella ginsengisoli]